MNGKTHLAFGIGTSVVAAGVLYSDTPAQGCILMGACILGSLLPDIDNPKSMLGNKVELLSRTVNKMFGHRGFIHSPLLLVGIYFGLGWILEKNEWGFYGWPLLYGLLIGYAGHLFLDFMTRGGIPLFYPFSRKHFRVTWMKSGKGYEGLVAGGLFSILTTCALLYAIYQ